jgi:divalent metal cation (Fe/Co/Zn/Cd) transporter
MADVTLQSRNRVSLGRRGRYLEYFTIGYNSLEGLIAVTAGLLAGSIALVGFGFDSLIEVTSGAVLRWRLHADLDEERREQVEAISLRIVGACFVLLAIYVSYDSVTSLIKREAPQESIVGIVLAAVSLMVMPLLVRAKRRVARGINSAALMADSKQTELCT